MKEDCIYVTTRTKVEDVINDVVSHQEEQEHPFYIYDVNDIIFKCKQWRALFPRVQPHYAVKCNNHQLVIRVLAASGVHFDCASKFEIKQVLSTGVDPSRIIFAHTCKPPSHVKYAAEKNVNLMTFDSKEELYKIKTYFPGARTVLRIKYDDPSALCVLGTKFGCDPYIEAEDLIKDALEQRIAVVGVSFHIGSGAKNAAVFYDAIKAARHVFNIAVRHGFTFDLLDIGGGYPGKHGDLVLPYAKYINSALDEYFPDESVRIISEPGTYFLESACTLACCVNSVREKTNDNKSICYNYYVNDGIFGNMSGIVSYNVDYVPRPLKVTKGEALYNSVIWGPTCDTIDKIRDDILLPKMDVGDYFVVDNIGSYSNVLSTLFNGFGVTMTYCVINYENMLLLKDTGHFKHIDFVFQNSINSVKDL